MSNYNKSFNFRNGVQVDEDDLIVRGSLVGIGTTIPRSELDVRGDINVVGLVTASNIYVAGIATFTDVRIGTGITIYGNAGIISATFYGDGSNLVNIPTSQWVDVDPGVGYTSIYAQGNVGIATTSPTSTLQVGGRVEDGDNGVGITSTGNIYASGIVTATSFVGSGANLTSLNASEITSGTISEDRLPENINITGIATIATLEVTQINNSGIATISDLKLGQTNISGVATVGFATVSAAYVNDLTAGVATVTSLTASSFISTPSITNLQRISVPGIATVGLLSASNVYVSGVTTTGLLVATTGIITSLTISNESSLNNVTVTNLNVTGITTVGMVTSPTAYVGVVTVSVANITGINAGVTTTTKLYSNSVRLGVGANNEIDTSSDNLILDSAGGVVQVDDNLVVSGYTYLTGITTISDSILPDSDQDAALGSASLRFSDAYIDNVRIGVGSDNEVSTGSGDLKLDSSSKLVQIADRLKVSGETYLTGISTVEIGLLPDADKSAYLGSSSQAFTEAYVNEIRIGVGGTNIVDTREGDLVLDSQTNNVVISNDITVNQTTNLSGNLYVGSVGNNLYVDQLNNKIGIGTSAPSNDIEVVKNGSLNVELISETGTTTIAIGQSLGIGNSSATLSYSNKDFNISNKDTGSINIEMSAGSGINTESFFNVIHGSDTLLAIGYSGVTGINKANPEHALDVNGNVVVSGSANFVGVVTIGQGAEQVTFGSGTASISGNLTGNVNALSGVSTFKDLVVDNTVSVGSTLSVDVGIGSFRTGVAIGDTSVLNTDGIQLTPVLNINGDAVISGSALFSEAVSKVGIATTGFLIDERPGLLAEESNFPSINYGVLQLKGDMSVTGYSGGTTVFVGGPVGASTHILQYQDTRILDDQNYQFRVGINTHIPRSCLDLGASASPLIIPGMDSARKQYMLDNPTSATINKYGAPDGDKSVPGSLIFRTDINRAELGIGTAGTFCGIATLTNNGTAFDAFVPPKLTTTDRNTMTTAGIPDGAIIYNISTNKLQLRASGSWVDLN